MTHNCIACGKLETPEEELVDVGKTDKMLCQDCYDDGITDSNIYLELKSLERNKK